MIAIVDYGVGNLFSLASSVRSLGAEVCVTGRAADLRAASHILLPGVGAFADAMGKLRATGPCAGAAGRGRAHAAAGHLPGHAAAV